MNAHRLSAVLAAAVAVSAACRTSASEPSAAASGTCVVDPIADTSARWTDPLQRGATTRADFASTPVGDIDDDGAPDVFVTSERVGCAGMGGNCVHAVYLSRAGCTRFGGFVSGAGHTVVVEPPRRGGIHDFRLLSQNGCAGRAGDVQRATWNGSRFVMSTVATCACPDDAPSEKRSPLCPR